MFHTIPQNYIIDLDVRFSAGARLESDSLISFYLSKHFILIIYCTYHIRYGYVIYVRLSFSYENVIVVLIEGAQSA